MPDLSSNGSLAGALAQVTAASYHCFDRVLLFGHLMGLTRAGGAHNICRHALGIEEITPEVLVARTERYRKWVYSLAQNRRIPILPSSPDVRNEDLVEPYYRRFRGKQGVVCILRTMENCLTYVSRKPRFATRDPKHRCLRSCRRRVQCFYSYLLDPEFGRCWVKVQTHLPFGVAVCFNGHQWLARRLEQLPLPFDRRDNCFMNAQDWGKLQQEADRLDSSAMCRLCDRWGHRLAPIFSRHLWLRLGCVLGSRIVQWNPTGRIRDPGTRSSSQAA